MMRHWIAIVLVLTLLCSSGALASVNTEGMPIVTEPIVLTCAITQSPIQGDLNEVVVFKNFEEKSGVQVKFRNIPTADRASELSLMLGSGQLPDILMKMSVSGTDQAKYAVDEGMFVPLSDYEELMPNLMRYFEQYPEVKEAVTLADGKIYAAPYILTGDAIRVGGKLWFNTDVLEQLNMSVPTTLDAFYDYLTACKGLDYNGNATSDEIPLTSASIDEIESVLAGSFGWMNRGYSQRDVFVDGEGNLQYAYSSDEYRETLKYLNKLYAEKLIDQDIFTMDFAQEIAKCSTGRALTYAMVNNSPVANTPYEEFSLGQSEPLTGYNGEKMWTNYSTPASNNGQFMITYKCMEKGEEYVKAAVRWMDHWYSDEGIIEMFMGIEGVTYEKDAMAPGGLKLTEAVLNDPEGRNFEQVMAEYTPWIGGGNPSVATDEYFKGGETWPACLEAVEGLRNYFPEEVWGPFTRFYSTEEAMEMSAIKTEQEQYWKEWRAYFIAGQKDVHDDQVWAEYVAGFEGVKNPRYMEIYRGAYEAHKAEASA